MKEKVGEMVPEGIESPDPMVDPEGEGGEGAVIGYTPRVADEKGLQKNFRKPGPVMDPRVSEDEILLIPNKRGGETVPVENGP